MIVNPIVSVRFQRSYLNPLDKLLFPNWYLSANGLVAEDLKPIVFTQ